MAKPNGPVTKDETFWQVLNTAVELDFLRGHLRWSLSELSRKSGITRSLIYYYFGSQKTSILAEAVKFIGEEIFGLNEVRMKMWHEGKILESVLATRKLVQENQHIAAFYVVQRTANTEVGESLRKLEAEYASKIRRFFPTLAPGVAEGIFGLFYGLTIAPNIPDRAIAQVVEVAIKEMKS